MAMEASMVAAYLEPYGYLARDPEEWRSPPGECPRRPSLRLRAGGHAERGGHTFYDVECRLELRAPAQDLEWQVPRRLAQLREGLHDVVKNELGKGYSQVFDKAPFAKRGGFGGTTERLQKWLETLTACLNDGTAPPALVVQVLLFLDAPAQSAHHQAAGKVAEEEQAAADPAPGPEASPSPPPSAAPPAAAPEAAKPAAEGGAGAAARAPRLSLSRQPTFSGGEEGLDEADEGPRPASRDASPPKDAQPARVQREATPTAVGGDSPKPEAPRRPGDGKPEAPQQPGNGKPAAAGQGARPPAGAGGDAKALAAVHLATPRPWVSYANAPPMDSEACRHVPEFLNPYGYQAAGPSEWRVAPGLFSGPKLRCEVTGHTEVGNHTLYQVQCTFAADELFLHLEWTAQLQLSQLRSDLHDVVKGSLGKSYAEAFADAPFARRGAPSGTTGRLQKWVACLAACLNCGMAPPVLVAHVLYVLKPPFRPEPRRPPPAAAGAERKERSKSEPPPRVAAPPRAVSPAEPRDGPAPSEDLSGGSGANSGGDDAPTDDEAWNAEKRRAGYEKLQRWFRELRRALERKVRRDAQDGSRSPRRAGDVA